MLTLTKDEFKKALIDLDKYYGITEEMLPDYLSHRVGTNVEIRWPFNSEALVQAFDMIGDSAQHQQLIKTLAVLTCAVLESPRLQRAFTPRDVFNELRQRDYLRLYVIQNSTREEDGITIRNKSRSIRLNNYSNWFVKELLNPFLKEKLSDVANLEEAIAELDKPKPVKKGRRPGDPRISILLWDTYLMLSDELPLKSPMPNNLCNFLITLLQIQKVLPASSVIDAFWIRAQLRYIHSRPEKPRFPITD